MFCCAAFGYALPLVRTMVQFGVVIGQKAVRPRAADVRPANESGATSSGGIFTHDKGGYGFTTVGNRKGTMFVRPKGFVVP